MLAHVASDFSPEVRFMFNASASVIPQGHFVCRAVTAVCAVQDPVAADSPTRNIIGIIQCAPSITANQEAVLGISMESIAASSWGPVCVGGPCQCVSSASASYPAGQAMGALGAGVSAGVAVPITLTTAPIAVPAWVLENQTVSGSAGTTNRLLNVFIEPIRRAGCGGIYT